jgi:YidC/Oxa1 family membrane protein insertase
MNGNNSNTFLAIGLSVLVLVLWQVFYIGPIVEEERKQAEIIAQREAVQSGQASPSDNAAIPQSDTTTAQAPASNNESEAEEEKRLTIDTELLIGSLNLRGARIDDLRLKKYKVENTEESPLITLLSPRNSSNPYFAEFGYLNSPTAGEVPSANTVWNASANTLGANSSVTLDWTNDKGIRFEREIALDDKYMFTITDRIANTSSDPVELTPYGRIARFGEPDTQGIFVLHEGLIGHFGDDEYEEVDYDDVREANEISLARTPRGWLGITDKYWAAALIPGTSFKPRFFHSDTGAELFQTDFVGEVTSIAAGSTSEVSNKLFAGAKVTEIIDGYQEDLNIHNFDLMIDWGWFYFITKPLFWLIHWLHGIFGNFGVAILGATVIIKAIFLPLANMSYASMAKMKKVQPEMTEMRERYGDDKMKQQQEMMAIYKREKINPAAGCLPMLVQIPVFFALYKVLFVTIEMRHAPFFGWIQDLAAPDPTSIFNLFGLLPFEVGGLFLVGIWPVIMGITMFLQFQMNPAPPDPTQAMIFKWLPLVFTFMLASFPAGLVIYWAWNNTLSLIQQGIIMKRHGAELALMDNLKGMFKRKPKETS